eukprot:tig00020943_g16295.t1
MFSVFDEINERYGLEKVKSIGDAVMMFTTKSPEAMIDFGLEAIEATRGLARELELPLDIRVGINTGSVVGGVIGTKKLMFDVWGDCVNLAARMESGGVAGRVQISSTTYEQVKYKFDVEERGPIELKGKGKQMAYLVRGRKSSQSIHRWSISRGRSETARWTLPPRPKTAERDGGEGSASEGEAGAALAAAYAYTSAAATATPATAHSRSVDASPRRAPLPSAPAAEPVVLLPPPVSLPVPAPAPAPAALPVHVGGVAWLGQNLPLDELPRSGADTSTVVSEC